MKTQANPLNSVQLAQALPAIAKQLDTFTGRGASIAAFLAHLLSPTDVHSGFTSTRRLHNTPGEATKLFIAGTHSSVALPAAGPDSANKWLSSFFAEEASTPDRTQQWLAVSSNKPETWFKISESGQFKYVHGTAELGLGTIRAAIDTPDEFLLSVAAHLATCPKQDSVFVDDNGTTYGLESNLCHDNHFQSTQTLIPLTQMKPTLQIDAPDFSTDSVEAFLASTQERTN